MASRWALPTWVSVWFTVASILVLMDSLYVLGIFYSVQDAIPATIKQLWTMYGETDTQYSVDGKGIAESNGWMPTQSHLNVVEVGGQILYLLTAAQRPATACSIALITSVATFWKTVCYMGIIAWSPNPLKHVPALTCAVAWTDSCVGDIIKFSFNLWWLAVPLLVIWACHARIAAAADAPPAAAASPKKKV